MIHPFIVLRCESTSVIISFDDYVCQSVHSVSYHYSQRETGHLTRSQYKWEHNQIYLQELHNHISIAFLVVNSKLAPEAFWNLLVCISQYHAWNNREPEDYTDLSFFFTSVLCLNTFVYIWVWSSWKNVNKSTLASNCLSTVAGTKGKLSDRTEQKYVHRLIVYWRNWLPHPPLVAVCRGSAAAFFCWFSSLICSFCLGLRNAPFSLL